MSPAIARLRTQLSATLRGAVLAENAQGRPDLLRRWLELPEGRDDRDGWQALRDSAGLDAVARARPAVTWPGWTSNSADAGRSVATVLQRSPA